MTLFEVNRPLSTPPDSLSNVRTEISFFRQRDELNKKLGKTSDRLVRLHSSPFRRIIGRLAASSLPLPRIAQLSEKYSARLGKVEEELETIVATKRKVVTDYYQANPPRELSHPIENPSYN